jgi:hypothetical protein
MQPLVSAAPTSHPGSFFDFAARKQRLESPPEGKVAGKIACRTGRALLALTS